MAPYFFVLIGAISGMEFVRSEETVAKKEIRVRRIKSIWNKITLNGKKHEILEEEC